MVCKHYAEGKPVKEDQRAEKKPFSHQKALLKEGKQLVRGREGNITGDQLSLKKRGQPSCSEVFSM